MPSQGRALNALVTGNTTKAAGCPDRAFICGHAAMEGFAAATYSFFLTSLEPVAGACGEESGGHYNATITFALEDGSQLTLYETGIVCGPGHSLMAPGGRLSYGNPVSGNGSWEIQDSTGQFIGMTGSGTNTFRSVGAVFAAMYSGNLGR